MCKLKKILKGILNAIFPPNVTCISCNAELKNDEERKICICGSCQKEFDYIGDRKQKIENKDLYIDEFFTVYAYDGKAKNLVVGFKDGNKPYLGEYIAKFIFDIINQKNIKADYISYVPSSKNKKNKRGYDHMRIVADNLYQLSKIAVIDNLGRHNKGADQTQTADRYKNIKGQFYYINDKNIDGKKIILIDDVVTTGATISECARLLKANKASSVILLTFTEAKSFEDYKISPVKRMLKHND